MSGFVELGATVGSFIPGVGTAIGGTVGGIVDTVSGLFEPDCPSSKGAVNQTNNFLNFLKSQGLDENSPPQDQVVQDYIQQGVYAMQHTCKKGYDKALQQLKNYYFSDIKDKVKVKAGNPIGTAGVSPIMLLLISGLALFFVFGGE